MQLSENNRKENNKTSFLVSYFFSMFIYFLYFLYRPLFIFHLSMLIWNFCQSDVFNLIARRLQAQTTFMCNNNWTLANSDFGSLHRSLILNGFEVSMGPHNAEMNENKWASTHTNTGWFIAGGAEKKLLNRWELFSTGDLVCGQLSQLHAAAHGKQHWIWNAQLGKIKYANKVCVSEAEQAHRYFWELKFGKSETWLSLYLIFFGLQPIIISSVD